MANTMLEIVSEKDEVVGQALRSEIHAKGLLHREIHLWFITPDKKVILQKRSMKKDTNPGLLTSSVGGHVELGQTYEQTALTEVKEETGLDIDQSDIVFFDYYRFEIIDEKTGMHNNSIRALFGMLFDQPVDDLVIEAGDGDGFVMIPYDDLAQPSDMMLSQASPKLLDEEFALIKDKLLALVK